MESVRAIFFVAAFCGAFLFSGLVEGKGGGSHGGSPASARTVAVHGYTKKDGTYVAPYNRAPPGTLSAGAYSSGGIPNEAGNDEEVNIVDLDARAHGTSAPRRAYTTKPQTSACQYRPVMTDEQIEVCKVEARATH